MNPSEDDLVFIFVTPAPPRPVNWMASDLVWMRWGTQEKIPKSRFWPQKICCYIVVSVKQNNFTWANLRRQKSMTVNFNYLLVPT